MLKNLKNNIIDFFRRSAIFKAALEKGCDPNGDIVIYKDTLYVIYIKDGICYRSKLNRDL